MGLNKTEGARSCRRPIIVVQGAQWGSEAKGAIAAWLCVTRNIDFAVRTGAINAGHTVVYNGKRYAMQQLPTGWINPNTKLVIGAGAYIHPETLLREIDMVNSAMPGQDVRKRLYIDSRCGVHDEGAEAASKAANRHHAIGATGKGCSEAIVAKIRNRNAGYQLFRDTPLGQSMDGTLFGDTVSLLHSAADAGQPILIEGTQGTMLDLHLGPYPFTTSRMTTAANWVAEAGLSPSLPYEVVLVVRTFPIRVAGNSGPMPGEIEWVDLARRINERRVAADLEPLVPEWALVQFEAAMADAALAAVNEQRYTVPVDGAGRFKLRLSEWTPEDRDLYRVAASELHRAAIQSLPQATHDALRALFEMTTVTKKLRRIARLDPGILRQASMINRPAWVAITFMDYLVPEMANATSPILDPVQREAAGKAMQVVRHISSLAGAPVRVASFGPELRHVIRTSELFATDAQSRRATYERAI